MKQYKKMISAALAVGCLTACAPPAPPVTASSQQAASSAPASKTPPAPLLEQGTALEQGDSLLAQIDALRAQLDTTLLPLMEDDRYSLDPNHRIDLLPPQLAIDTPEAYMLANQVRNLLYEGGNILEDFDNPQDALFAPILKTAIYRTAPIAPRAWEDEAFRETNADHIVTELVARETENGRIPDEIYYADEVEAVIHHLFGDEVSGAHGDIDPYYYFEKAGVYTNPRTVRAQWWVYPQMTMIEKTANGYVCEAVMVSALEQDTSMETRDGIVLTRENFEQASINSPKYRYTFREEADGRLTLKKFQTLRNPNREGAKG